MGGGGAGTREMALEGKKNGWIWERNRTRSWTQCGREEEGETGGQWPESGLSNRFERDGLQVPF